LLALDIEVGSDIIKTVLTPLIPELLALAVVVAIRIALVFVTGYWRRI